MRTLAAAALILTTTCSAFAENVKQIISDDYLAVTHAMQTHDLSSIGKMLTPDYRAISQDGKSIGRADVLKQFQMQSNTMTDFTWQRKIQEFHVGHGVALATVSGHLSGFSKGKKRSHFELVATTKDTWKKVGGKWLLKSSQLVSSKMTIDGKPFNMG